MGKVNMKLEIVSYSNLQKYIIELIDSYSLARSSECDIGKIADSTYQREGSRAVPVVDERTFRFIVDNNNLMGKTVSAYSDFVRAEEIFRAALSNLPPEISTYRIHQVLGITQPRVKRWRNNK